MTAPTRSHPSVRLTLACAFADAQQAAAERATPPGHARDDWPVDRDVEPYVRDFDHGDALRQLATDRAVRADAAKACEDARLAIPKVVRAIGESGPAPVRLADLLAADALSEPPAT